MVITFWDEITTIRAQNHTTISVISLPGPFLVILKATIMLTSPVPGNKSPTCTNIIVCVTTWSNVWICCVSIMLLLLKRCSWTYIENNCYIYIYIYVCVCVCVCVCAHQFIMKRYICGGQNCMKDTTVTVLWISCHTRGQFKLKWPSYQNTDSNYRYKKVARHYDRIPVPVLKFDPSLPWQASLPRCVSIS